MNYKTELQSNNADLAAILEAVNALPEATEPKEPVIEELNVTANGTYPAPDGVDGYSPVTVNVPIPEGYIKPSGELQITENGTHDVTEYASVDVEVEGFTPPDSEYLDPNEVYRTTRPSDWLPMPTPGDDEIYLLGQLVEGIDNKFSIYLSYSGSCTVQIGTVVDGVFVAQRTLSVTSGMAFTYVVPWDEYGDTTSEGYRQYMVKCKGKISVAGIDKQTAGISSIVDCAVGIPNVRFYAGHTGESGKTCHTLRYLRFVGNGYPQFTQGIVGYCGSCLCVSCEKQLTSNTYPNYSYPSATSLIAVSPELLVANGNMTYMFANTRLRRIPTQNLRPANLSNCFRDSSVIHIDGSTFGNCATWSYCFYQCRILKEAVNLDITKATALDGTFGYCDSLEKLTFAGTTAVGGYTIDLTRCKLSHTALVTMIASLPTATNAATITITNNPGAAELTADEIAVATAKNWTITI